ncbi:hypothetical protein GALMADRAFT_406370 [Galerina marginata CBS 339.88]|uniref:Uncharacterized protein n=1 Tax=Galerina marginata (strain CBS 339.88) TaxID=685588 RepID=A0A067TC86_GALM3|nr:hypothetical protein GALMADRAFT_406370 [Galerina marginata CBS 339.88]
MNSNPSPDPKTAFKYGLSTHIYRESNIICLYIYDILLSTQNPPRPGIPSHRASTVFTLSEPEHPVLVFVIVIIVVLSSFICCFCLRYSCFVLRMHPPPPPLSLSNTSSNTKMYYTYPII